MRRDWAILAPGWALLVYIAVAQGVAAIDYEIGVRMGTQESAALITEVGTAFWYGFALGDLVIYLPLLAAGLHGWWGRKRWAVPVLGAALGITVYWPVVSLATIVAARDADGWRLADETAYWVVLPAIALWAAFGLYRVILGAAGNVGSNPRLR